MPRPEPEALFGRLAADWDSRRVWPCYPEKLARVAAEGGPPPDGSLLDAGTGTGVLIPHLLVHRPKVVWACDLSLPMLRQVRSKFGVNWRVQPVQADVTRLNLAPASVDTAYWNGLYPHLEDPSAALREAWRVLKPGGRLVVSHLMGRRRTNQVHHEAGGALRGHLLPPAGEVCGRLRQAGLTVLRAEDEDRFFLITAEKVLPQ